jgi:hypothetical protein
MPVATVAAGLLSGVLELRSGCHRAVWQASEIEREQMHEYLAAVLIQQPLKPVDSSTPTRTDQT